MDESLGLHSLYLVSSLVGYCLGMGLFFFDSGPVSFYFWFVGQLIFLPRSCTASAMVSPNLTSSAHFIPLDIPDPFHSFGHPWPISFLHSHGLLRNLSGFSVPITISFIFGVCWPLHQSHLLIHFFGLFRPIFTYFLLLTILMGLLLPSLGLLWAYLLSLGSFYYFVGLCTIIPTI